MTAYDNLSDEDKVLEAIRFRARGAELPHQLKKFLQELGIYELIVNPVEIDNGYSNQGRDIADIGPVT